MEESLKKYYDLFKNNWTIIALLPTVTGGMWQIYQLATISVNMIRFFSISQLFSDGIIILVFFLVMTSIIVPLRIKILPNTNVQRKRFVLYTIIAFIVIVMTFYSFLIFNLKQYITIDKPLSLLVVYAIPCCIIYLLHFLEKKKMRNYFVILYFVINTFITVIALGGITKNFSGIENFNTLINLIEKKDCYSKKPAILYFNDKYIFIELEKKNKKAY